MALRLHYPHVCLLYWDSTLDSHLPNPEHSAIWTSEYLGNNWGPVTTGPAANWQPGQGCGSTLTRYSGISGRTIIQSDIDLLLSKTTFQEIACCDLENAHGALHGFVGGPDGQMGGMVCAPNDPVFFLHHTFIDCLWEEFRQGSQTTSIEFEYPVNMGGVEHHPYDRMDPWIDLYNIHGLGSHYTDYYYNYAPRPSSVTCTDDASTGSDILWCDNGKVKAKVREGRNCNGLPNNACYCSGQSETPACSGGTCTCP